MEVRISQDGNLEKFEDAGLNVMDYDKRDGRYRIILKPGEVEQHKDVLLTLIKKAKGIEDAS